MLHSLPSHAIDINSEITRSFKNTNYAQWERQTKSGGANQLRNDKSSRSIAPEKLSSVTNLSSVSSTLLSMPTTGPTTVVASAVAFVVNKSNSSSNRQQPRAARAVSRASPSFPAHYSHNKPNGGGVRLLPERNCSPCCNHNKTAAGGEHRAARSFKNKRQLKEEDDARNLLRTKIKFAQDHIRLLKDREQELIEQNCQLIEAIDARDTQTNVKVDGILRKYEKYKEVKKTISKKHYEEVKAAQAELRAVRAECAAELPKYERASEEMERAVTNAEQLCKQLFIYKNQEYPEKLLQINGLRKKLADLYALHAEEQQNLNEIVKQERRAMRQHETQTARLFSEKISTKAINQMHESLKDMATFNTTMKQEITFYMSLQDELALQVQQLELDIGTLRNNAKRDVKLVLFADIFQTRDKCTPDMEVILNLPKKKAF